MFCCCLYSQVVIGISDVHHRDVHPGQLASKCSMSAVPVLGWRKWISCSLGRNDSNTRRSCLDNFSSFQQNRSTWAQTDPVGLNPILCNSCSPHPQPATTRFGPTMSPAVPKTDPKTEPRSRKLFPPLQSERVPAVSPVKTRSTGTFRLHCQTVECVWNQPHLFCPASCIFWRVWGNLWRTASQDRQTASPGPCLLQSRCNSVRSCSESRKNNNETQTVVTSSILKIETFLSSLRSQCFQVHFDISRYLWTPKHWAFISSAKKNSKHSQKVRNKPFFFTKTSTQYPSFSGCRCVDRGFVEIFHTLNQRFVSKLFFQTWRYDLLYAQPRK